MEDSNNNNVDSSLNDNNNNNRDDGINHERLVALSNYADQNQDNPSWYWNTVNASEPGHHSRPPTGWSVYRPLSDLSEVERADIRNGETKMVSHINPQRYDGTGLSLDWGEYYVADDEMSNSGDEESTLSEAEEINDGEVNEEEILANFIAEQVPFKMNYDQLNINVTSSNPTLMGMPDIILEKILHYSTEQPSEVCVVERVCKRVRRLTNSDDFWVRHPYICRYYPRRRASFGTSTPRRIAFTRQGVRMIRKYQKVVHHNAFLGILGDDGEDCVADTFRTLSADILSRMNHIGPEAHFRLRGDAIGYICELLQGFMVSRLDMAMHLAIHKIGFTPSDYAAARGNSTKCTVERDDVALAFQKDMFSPFFCGHSPLNTRCNVSIGFHGQGSTDVCSCSLPSSSGVIWKWPSDNCHEVLPPEAGRRIIRWLAYKSGILQMSNEAFILAEAELLHMLGVLLVTAYESSVKMAKTTQQLLGEEDELAYNEPTDSIDMFQIPPPPFQNEKEVVYTIVPGQIRAAAEDRDITPSSVYGDVWVASSGFTKEEEDEIERSYYYQSISLSDDKEEEEDDDEYSDSDSDILNWKYERIGSKAKVEDDLDDWSECSSVEDSEMDMDDYEEDSYLAEYHHGRDEIEAHYNHFPLNDMESDNDEEEDEEEGMAVDNDA